ncbi:MAG: hypothetical protein Q9227_008782 [Pyrenula ochraceoflavens]
MEDLESLERLRDLHQDLTAFSELKLPILDRLLHELEDSVQDLRNLLAKPHKDNTSRQAVNSGKLNFEVGEVEINEDFKQAALEVADALDLDEIRAAKLIISVTESPDTHFQPSIGASIAAFHERRSLIAQCLRLLLHTSYGDSQPQDTQHLLREVVKEVLSIRNGSNQNGSSYARHCLTAMNDIERWQNLLVEQGQKASILGQDQAHASSQLLELQRDSLSEQHEALGACLFYLVKADFTISEDLRRIVEDLRKKGRFDAAITHYIPALNAAFAQYGSLEGSGTLREARSLDHFITQIHKSSDTTKQMPLESVFVLLWLAHYSSWYREPGNLSPLQGVDLDNESQTRLDLVSKVLEEGALEHLLSICAVLTVDEWHNPARQEMVSLLLSNSSALSLDGLESSSEYFRQLTMESMESFAENWITNMPDAIRRLKSREDEERLQYIVTHRNLDPGSQPDISENKLHLESFLVLMSFAFEHRPEAAEDFWADSDSNLYGFLRWSSKRQTVPRVSAFCDMLCAISEGESAAEAAHNFLLEEEYQTASRFRKWPSMNYGQMFAELEFYSVKINERPQSRRPLPPVSDLGAAEMNELESPVMLSCYLRLIAHMCGQSFSARDFLLSYKNFDMITVLFQLSTGPVPSYLRASIFATFRALFTQQSPPSSYDMWSRLDQWASGEAGTSQGVVPGQNVKSRQQNLVQYLESIATSMDQAISYVGLLKSLISLRPAENTESSYTLTFPENLGSAYRLPGIEPYIDFVVGMVFVKRSSDSTEEPPNWLVRFRCLDFMASCLEIFDSRVVDTASQKQGALPANPGSKEEQYLLLHPFARVMQWLFNVDVIKLLFTCTKAPLDQVQRSSSDSVLIATLKRSIDILNFMLSHEADYLDVVRPLVRVGSKGAMTISESGFSSFDECIFNFSSFLGDFREYSGTQHDELVLRSLALLQKLTTSGKLAHGTDMANGPRQIRHPIHILDPRVSDDATSINLIMRMRFNVAELEQGPDSPAYVIKDGICAFLNGCLEVLSDVPNIAHPLLGFTIVGNSLAVPPGGLIDNGTSLLHSLLHLVQSYPDGEGSNFKSWFLHLKRVSFEILKNLWSARLSTVLTMGEMRKAKLLRGLMLNQQLLSPDSFWDGVPQGADYFFFGSSADALAEFLAFRRLLSEYALTELRTVSDVGLSAAKNDVVALILGLSNDGSEPENDGTTLFDLFDVAEVDTGPNLQMPCPAFLSPIDLQSYTFPSAVPDIVFYDLDKLRDSLQWNLTRSAQDQSRNSAEKDRMGLEAEEIFQFADVSNRVNLVRVNKIHALHSWVELAILTLECCSRDRTSQMQVALQLLQLVLPKFEPLLLDSTVETIDLARLADSLMKVLETSLDMQNHDRTAGPVHDKVRQLFRICLSGVHAPNASLRLRSLMYTTCSRYLVHIMGDEPKMMKYRQQSLEAVTRAGTRVLNTICNDADTAEDSGRLPALVFLRLLASLGHKQKSLAVLQSLIQVNFIDALIEPINTVAVDLQESAASDFESHSALQRYHQLVASVLRLLTATFVTLGMENKRAEHQIRQFLQEFRPNMVGMFKRYAGIGGKSGENLNEELNSIVRSYTALVQIAKFTEVCQSSSIASSSNASSKKRLQVSNLRTAPKTNQQQYFNKIWTQLDSALEAIFHGKEPPYSLEELYKGSENLCRQGSAGLLYDKVRQRCKENAISSKERLLARGQQVEDVDLVQTFAETWSTWDQQMASLIKLPDTV